MPDAGPATAEHADAFWLALCPSLVLATDAPRGAVLALCLLVLAATLWPTLALLQTRPPPLRGTLTAVAVVAIAGSLGVVATALDYGARDVLQFGVPLLALVLAVPATGGTPASTQLHRILAAALLLAATGAARAALAPWPLLTQPFAVLLLLALCLGARSAWQPHRPADRP